MPTFSSYDDTILAYHVLGDGAPLVCVPGGPMRDSAYLGDLGGLSATARLVVLDHRGTGESATPLDAGSYRCDRVVEDVEALRRQLGLDRISLLGHSAGTNVVVQYAARYPDRVARLLLVTPSVWAVGLTVMVEQRRAVTTLRAGEPWYAEAAAAFARVNAGEAADDDWDLLTPFMYGRWDAATRAVAAEGDADQNEEAAAVFGSESAFDPPATRAALAGLTAPVLLIAGEVDVNSPPAVVAEYAALIPDPTYVVLPGCAHFPWLDASEAFVRTVTGFLGAEQSPSPHPLS